MACETALTPEEKVVLEARLVDAEKAYHALMTGTSARVVVDGLSAERVEFTSANAGLLNGYILKLKGQLGKLAPANCRAVAYGPARFIF